MEKPAYFQPTDEIEQNILISFFDSIASVETPDNTLSDSKAFKDTQSKLKTALRNAEYRCSCAKRTYGGPCEICQATPGNLHTLRNFFRVIRTAKKHNMSPGELKEFIANNKKWLNR